MNIKDYSVVKDYEKDVCILCENKNLQKLREEISLRENDKLPDYDSLEYFLDSSSGRLEVGHSERLESMYIGNIVVNEYDCINELSENFDKYVSEEELRRSLSSEVCFWKFLRSKVDKLYKALMIRCAEDLLVKANSMKC